ncbi:vesicle coat protein [Annulohypoxylon truncatum]|uniref:vesicle coat protein n=1 Tax=Annulohypoxylon truncatum TaxID=327061 RepID=UPI0020085FBE|nr:vesicle coat protein [Annulohypoxylon truncatum]KAI1207700.1 vesicle coat protein [Annulohypoxylon truncatum]
MTSILCLAHYCDLHGPTPLMVTEGLPVPCGQCCDETTDPARPQTSAAAHGVQTTVTDSLRKMTLGSPRSSSTPATEYEAQTHRASILRGSKLGPGSAAHSASLTTAAVQTPPQSPRNAPEGFPEANSKGNLRRDSSFRRTYDDYVTKRANPCQNCALTLPKRQDPKSGKDESTSTTADSKSDQRGPILRTRAPYARVFGGNGEFSPPSSNPQSSYPSDVEEDILPGDDARRPASRRRPTTSTSHSSVSSRSSVAQHTHYLDYTSTHEPVVPTTYSIVRASCLRTLSFETLPRRPETSQQGSSLSSPISSIPPQFPSAPFNHGPGYITATPNPQSAANGGPIFFGDPLAGYTTAYIFRIPDVHARGRKRVYAFLALSTHRERLAMKTFSFISAAFRDLVNWIQELAEAEAEREREREEANSPVAALNAAYSQTGFGGDGPRDSGIGLGLGGGFGGSNLDRDRGRERANETSSFLTGGGRGGFVQRMGGSMGPGGFAPKARGLAELVGLPDFFIELHSRFVQLLLELGVVLSS